MLTPKLTLLAAALLANCCGFYAKGAEAAPITSPGVALGELCGKQGVSCIFAGPGITVTGEGLIASSPTLTGGHWYLSSDDGSYGKAEGCADASTIFFSLGRLLKVYKGNATDKTHNAKIQGCFSTNPSQVSIKGDLSTRQSGADLYLSCV